MRRRKREEQEATRSATEEIFNKGQEEREKALSGEDWSVEAGSVDWVTLRKTERHPYNNVANSKVKLSRADSPALVELEVSNDYGSRTDIARSSVTVSRQKLIDALLQLPKEPR